MAIENNLIQVSRTKLSKVEKKWEKGDYGMRVTLGQALIREFGLDKVVGFESKFPNLASSNSVTSVTGSRHVKLIK
jgi:hypothetical protein